MMKFKDVFDIGGSRSEEAGDSQNLLDFLILFAYNSFGYLVNKNFAYETMKKQQKLFALIFLCSILFKFISFSTSKNEYLNYVKQAVKKSWAKYPELIEEWKKTNSNYVLWGYNPPGEPVYLADALGFLYEVTKDKSYAERAVKILAEYSKLRAFYPDEFAKVRVEYSDGVPALPNFFFLFAYVRAYLRVKDSGLLSKELNDKISADISKSVNFISYFPEWGAHNRAVLRALAYLLGAKAFPENPSSQSWKKQAEILIYDNLGKWESEDATLYNGVWLYAMLIYIENSNNDEILNHPIFRYYFDYYLNLLTPYGTMVDLGDANFNNAFEWFIPCFEKAASFYKDGRYKYVAERIFNRMIIDAKSSAGLASIISDAYRWCDGKVKVEIPKFKSCEVLDDIVGKKIVFRTGLDSLSTYLLLNYRDEGDGNYITRDYLRNTITVEEEKMHHGSSDENSIIFFMTEGSILLHNAGYRDALPSGMFGAYRADYYHNRVVVRKNKREARNSIISIARIPEIKQKKQTFLEFVRNSGNYRQVRTLKVDFVPFKEVEYSRTRVIDEKIGYSWDRIISYLKKLNWFVIVDVIKFTQSDYYTLGTLWHTQRILKHGENFYDTRIDSIGGYRVGGDYNLLIYFPETYAREDSFEAEIRHYQKEFCIYQTASSHYKSGDIEFFVTFLIPHRTGEDVENLISRIKPVDVDKVPYGIGYEIITGEGKIFLCFKLDIDSEILRENIRPRYTFDSGRIKYGALETDAHFSYLIHDPKKLYFACSNFIKFVFDGQVLYGAKPYTFPLQPDGGPDRVGYTKIRFWEDEIKVEGDR